MVAEAPIVPNLAMTLANVLNYQGLIELDKGDKSSCKKPCSWYFTMTIYLFFPSQNGADGE